MNTTDEQRLALRPDLSLAPAAAPEEQFQNNTLRPIMKLQAPLLQAVLRMFLTKRKVKIYEAPAAEKIAKVKEMVTRDNRLRGLLFGIALGQFTAEEMNYYVAHESEVNRRMTNLLVERLAV